MSPLKRLSQIRSHITRNNSPKSNISSSTRMVSSKTQFLTDEIFFGHDTVNRVSFLREDVQFIRLALTNPTTKIAVFWNDQVVGEYHPIDETHNKIQLYYSNYTELNTFIDDFLNYNEKEDIRVNDLRFTFLGLDERVEDIVGIVSYKDRYKGLAYFGVDISNHKQVQEYFTSKFNDNLKLIGNRNDIFRLENFDSSIFSHAKMYLDWLKRNQFCAGCGSKTIPIHCGTKLICSSDVEAKCPVKNASVSNVSFPRTDSVTIVAITNKDYSKILLGRGKRYPTPMYSCIAGFMEPSETIEIASLREVWEETGVKASDLIILKSQPWPYPANLMIGCIAIVKFNGKDEVIDLGHDPELADAKWFNTEDIKFMLYENKLKSKDGSWQLPPKNAIAHHLVEHVVKKRDQLLQN